MKELILTGFMGTGKTMVGRLLADRYGLHFVDTDQEIERRTGQTVAQIFATQGEAAFRRLETAVLAGVLEGEREGESRVIATGGGALLSAGNRALLGNGHTVICLTCAPRELERRLAGNEERPLLAGTTVDGVTPSAQRIAALLEARAEVYDRFAQIDTTTRAPERIAEEVARTAGLEVAACWTTDASRTSEVVFARGALTSLGAILRKREMAGDILVVSDRTVAGLGWLARLRSGLDESDYTIHEVILPCGESRKTLGTLQEIYAMCAASKLDRQAILVGLGGGVIGDLTGLAAATYLRGLRLVLIPTTLVAQADAAIGGKVGVDFQNVKNLIGAFHPAEVIVVDPEVLDTLPDARLTEGMAEIVKIAAVRSAALLERLDKLAGPRAVIDHAHLIRWAAVEKVRVVRADPYERGERALLNFGHTVGHAVEAASGYALAHGQAVAIGMVAETWLAERNGWCESGVATRLAGLLRRFALPLCAPELAVSSMVPLVGQDKKRAAGQVRLAVPTRLGEGAVFAASEDDVVAALSFATGERS